MVYNGTNLPYHRFSLPSLDVKCGCMTYRHHVHPVIILTSTPTHTPFLDHFLAFAMMINTELALTTLHSVSHFVSHRRQDQWT